MLTISGGSSVADAVYQLLRGTPLDRVLNAWSNPVGVAEVVSEIKRDEEVQRVSIAHDRTQQSRSGGPDVAYHHSTLNCHGLYGLDAALFAAPMDPQE